jgi:hypothetical protein
MNFVSDNNGVPWRQRHTGETFDTGGLHMSLPEGLYPEKVFYYFEEISNSARFRQYKSFG